MNAITSRGQITRAARAAADLTSPEPFTYSFCAKPVERSLYIWPLVEASM